MASLPLTEVSGDALAEAKVRRVARKFRAVMEELDLDLGDPHLEGTELRVARAYRELFRGLAAGAEPPLRTFPNTEGYREIVSLTGIPFYSLCAHHFLPFFGSVVSNITALVSELGKNGLVGLIALGIILWLFSKRTMA